MDVTYKPSARNIDENWWHCQYVRTTYVSGDTQQQILPGPDDHRHRSKEEALACSVEQIRRMQTAEGHG